MPKPKVVLDTNVLVSGLILNHGRAYQILESWHKQLIEIYVSPELINELIDVIQRPKISKYCQSEVHDLQHLIARLRLNLITTHPSVAWKFLRDPKDSYLLDLCFSASADFLITGDKDLLSIQEKLPFKIITPAQFCQLHHL